MNVKEYTIRINGITTSIKDITSLEKALTALDKKAKAINILPKTSRSKALSDEEKAARKLANTQKKLNEINSAASRIQIEATQQLREKQREISREIALNQLAEGSVKAMGMQLTNLRNEYENLSQAERENIDIGGKLLSQIQALDAKYKSIRESTGNFRDSVGNYEKALKSLNKLDKGLNQISGTVNGLSSAFVSSTALMGIFGTVTKDTEKAQAELAKIIALVTVAQQLNALATKKSTASILLHATADKIATAQTKAKALAEALATKNTIAATIAQKAFNLVAYANPYVLLAMSLVGVIAALATFSDSTKQAAEAQRELNKEQEDWQAYLDEESERLKKESALRVADMERRLALQKAQGADLKKIHETERAVINEKINLGYKLKGTQSAYNDVIKKGKQELARLEEELKKIKNSKGKVEVLVDVNEEKVKLKAEEARKLLEEKISNQKYAIDVKVNVLEDIKNKETEEQIIKKRQETELKEKAKREAEEAKRAKEEAKRKAEEARRNAQERASVELEAQRKIEDLKLKLAGQTLETQKKLIQVDYDRQIEDLKIRLKEKNNISVKAAQAINDQIVLLEKLKNDKLEKLQDEIVLKEKETARLLQDQETALVKGNTEKRIKEIDIVYDRHIEDTQRRLRVEKDLTDQQRKDLNQMIINYDKQREAEIDDLISKNLKRRADLEIQTAENTLKVIQNKIGAIVVRKKGGFLDGIIDPEATKANLEETNKALSDYVNGLTIYRNDLRKAHEATLQTLKKGSLEYKEELQKYAVATEEVTQKIKETQEQQAYNTKQATELIGQYYSEVFDKIAYYAEQAVQALSPILDTFNMGLQASMDSLNEQLEAMDEKYEKAKELHEKAAEAVKQTEEKMQSATGGTTEVLRQQLQDQMHARDEAAREEQRIAKEKEKLEAEVAKKEKQMKRNELISNIATATADVAQAVAKALTAGPFIGQVMAGITAAMGATQIAIMTKQLSKLEKGGPIVGPSHQKGGVNILINGKPTYEAQGGEFMINDKSYSRNKNLTEFLNTSTETLTAADLVGVVPGFDAVPVTVNDVGSDSSTDIINAIKGINIKPVVSVTDIIDVTDQVTNVRDLAGV